MEARKFHLSKVCCASCVYSPHAVLLHIRGGGGGFPCGIRVDIPCECLSNSLSFRVVVAVEHHLVHC